MVGVITLMDVCVLVDGVGLTAVLVGSKQYTSGVYCNSYTTVTRDLSLENIRSRERSLRER